MRSTTFLFLCFFTVFWDSVGFSVGIWLGSGLSFIFGFPMFLSFKVQRSAMNRSFSACFFEFIVPREYVLLTIARAK